MVLVAVGIYGLVVKRNAIRMLFSIEIIANAANLLLVAFSRGLPNAQGQVVALFSIAIAAAERSEEHTSELQSRQYLVCRLLLEKKRGDVIAAGPRAEGLQSQLAD